MTRLLFALICMNIWWSNTCAQDKNALMLQHGLSMLGAEYKAHTLDQGDTEELVTDRSQLDCTIFVEFCAAMTLASNSDGQFTEDDYANELCRIRYRNGEMLGYTSRLHYIADWIVDNEHKGIIEDITAIYSPRTDTIQLSYMTTHHGSYRHLKDSPANVAYMADIEKKLSGTIYHWLPKSELPNEGLSWIKSGDIVFLTTNINGLDVTHAGIAIYRNGKLHLLHASSVAKKVIVSKETLRHELFQNKRTTGIRVVRMK